MSKSLLIVLEIQVGQDLALSALNSTLDSSTNIKIKNEVSYNFYKETKWKPSLTKLAWYSSFKLIDLFANLAMTFNLEPSFQNIYIVGV
jgi:hypothetical protein